MAAGRPHQREKSYEALLRAHREKFIAWSILAEDPETSLYVHCKGCQEPYLKADFHCSHSHENFTKDQEDSFKAHTKRIANEIPNESRYPKLSVEFKVLKAVLFDIEAAIPEEAVRSEGRGNSRKIWLEKLKASLSIQQVIPCVQDLEKKHDREWLRPSFNQSKWHAGLRGCKTPQQVIDHLIEFDGNVHYKPPTKSKMGSPRQHRPGPNDGKLGSTSSCVRKKRMKKSLGKVSLERPKPGECAFCRRDIGGGVGVRCTVCLGLELCLECFSQGISYPPHQKSHPYELCCGRDNKRRSREGLIHETSGRKRRRISSGCGESSSSSSSSSCRGNDIGQRSRMPKKQQQQQQQCLLLPMNGAGYSPVMMYLWENIDPEIIAEFSKISGSAINSKAPYSSHEEEGTVDLNCTQSSLPREERKRDFVRKLESRAAIGEDKGCCKLSASSTEGGGNNIEKTRQAKDKDDADSSKAFHSSAGAAPRQQQQQQQQSRSEEERPCDGTISKLKAVFKLAMCYFLGFGTRTDEKTRSRQVMSLLKPVAESLLTPSPKASGKNKGIGHSPYENGARQKGATLSGSSTGQQQRRKDLRKIQAKILFAAGICLEYGYGTHRAQRKARLMYEAASALGLGIANSKLQELYLNKKRAEKATPLPEHTKDGGYWYMLGIIYLGRGMLQLAISAFEEAANLRHPRACYNLGVCLSFLPKSRGGGGKKEEGEESLNINGTADDKACFGRSESAAQRSGIETDDDHGTACFQAVDKREDRESSIEFYFQMASDAGDPSAHYNLALTSSSMQGNGEPKFGRGATRSLLELAVRGGHINAMYNLGRLFHRQGAADRSAQGGEGLFATKGGGENEGQNSCCDEKEKNLRMACSLYKRAAKKGHVASMYNLGVLFDSGLLQQEEAMRKRKACKWYTRAAKRGDQRALYNLGVLYANGDVEGGRDLKKAKLLFRHASVCSPKVEKQRTFSVSVVQK